MSDEQYRAILEDDAKKQFAKLDKPVQQRVTIALVKLETDPRPSRVTKLKGKSGRLRIRVGDWRIIYKINDGQVVVLVIAIGHRSEVYKNI